VPVLVGPEHKIRAVAAETGADLSGVELVSTEHSHAAVEAAVRRAGREGRCALMKGSLHTDELMSEVVLPQSGLRTGRRISHVM
jgi:phosphate acetyltransferase